MAKELPYFKFEPAEYLTKDISFCSLPAQGLFINLCSYYWQRECKLTKDQFLRRFNNELEFNELLNEGVFDVCKEGFISIKFLNIQYELATNQSLTNSKNGSKGGRPKKAKLNPNESEIKPNENPNESESKGIREEEIKEDNINSDIDFKLLLNFFNETYGRKLNVISNKTKKQIKERLKEGYSKEDLKHALLNAKNDPYHIENNFKYITLEFISRSDKFERYSQIHETNVKPRMI